MPGHQAHQGALQKIGEVSDVDLASQGFVHAELDAGQRATLFLGTQTERPVFRVTNSVLQVDGAMLNTQLLGDRTLSPTAERILNDHGIQTRVGVPVALPRTGSGGLADPDSSPDFWLLPLAVAIAMATAAAVGLALRRPRVI